MVAFPFAHIACSVSVVLLNLFPADLIKGRTSPSGAPLALDPEHRNRRPLFRLFLLAFGWLLVSLPALASTSLVWFSTSDNLFQISGESNTVVQTLPMSGVGQLAADSGGVVWTVTDKQLSKRGPDGGTLFQADFKTLGLHSEPTIAVDPYDNSLWLADKKTVLHLDTNGQNLRSFPTPFANVRQIQVSPDQTLWMLGNKQLAHYSASGVVIASFDLHAVATAEPKFFIVDDLGRAIWLAGEKNLIQVDLASAQQVLRRVVLGDKVIGLVLQPKNGAVWALSKDSLATYDATGTLVRNIVFKSQAISGPDMLVFDPVGDSVWMTHHAGVVRFSLTGDLRANIATQKSAQEIAAVPFILLPEISLVSPANGLLTNKPNLPFTLQYGVSCNGQPCTFTTSYLGTYSLNAILNGQAVGNLFAFDTTSGKATFTPTSRLPEGINTFTAQARDSFGHLSQPVSSTFAIDTIPPKFLALVPAEGSISSKPQVTVSGTIDEPGQVLLENLADFAGAGANPAGINFGFGLTLNPGPNSVRLRANDLAGNITNKTLNLTYAPGMSIVIDSPVDGTAVTGNSVALTGTFQGPTNLGITVNGVVAAVYGNNFYANVALQSGSNLLTVIGSTPELASVTKTVAVTGGTSPFQVSAFPQNGIAPHSVNFSVFSGASDVVARIDVDFNGDGVTDFTTTAPNATIQTTYTAPGVYRPTVTVTDTQGRTYTSTQVMVVASVATLDAKLRGIYAGMLARLRVGDIEGALNAFTDNAAKRYRPVFEDLRPNLATVVDQLGAVADGLISDGFAEYVLVQDAPTGRQAFLMYFIRGSDGVWRISQM